MEHWKKLLHHRHGPFLIAAVVALVALPILIAFLRGLAPAISAVIFFALYLVMMAFRIPALDGQVLRRRAPPNDEPEPVILIVTLLAAVTAVALLFQVLNGSAQAGIGEIALAFASVVLGWLTIHTMFAMHYAHRFWRPTDMPEDEPSSAKLAKQGKAATRPRDAKQAQAGKSSKGAGTQTAKPASSEKPLKTTELVRQDQKPDQKPGQKQENRPKWHGGLDFPQTSAPGGYDFLYFSFVIGMTAQTSDVAITTTGMRKLNLVHAVVSFFFNAVLIAAAVNAAVSLGGN
ncbi:MAG: DUF1345 domain-containing protein [Neorhizobium sp.]|nr:DUF1345 domain-containing protein [Neorhizobium sp.]